MLLPEDERETREASYWTYVEPGEDGGAEYHTFSEMEVLNKYFQPWSNRMKSIGREHLVSREACISDWVVIHHAWRVTQ